jgi:hypothetical protein
MHEGEFSGRSADQQKALSNALHDAVIKLLPRPDKKKENEKDKPKIKTADILVLRGKKVALEISMLSRGTPGEGAPVEERYIRHVFEQFLIQHVEAQIVPPEETNIVILVSVQAFGVNVDARFLPIQYIPVFSAVNVEAVAGISVFVYQKESNETIFRKLVGAREKYDRYSLFGFVF